VGLVIQEMQKLFILFYQLVFSHNTFGDNFATFILKILSSLKKLMQSF